MGVLIWTSSILLILSLLSYSLIGSFVGQRLLTSYLAQETTMLESSSLFDLSSKARYTYFQQSKREAPPPDTEHAKETASQEHKKKPRLTSKIHLSPATFIALNENSGSERFSSPGEQLLYNLLLNLYEGIGSLLDTSDSEAIKRVVKGLTEVLTRYDGKYSKTHAKILANFELQEQQVQECLWNMLHGRTKEKREWPSLISFISFQKKNYLTSLWLSPKRVLKAIFAEDKTVDELLQKRQAIYNALLRKDNKQDEQASQLESEWRTLCEKSLPSWLPPNMVDLHISKTVAHE